MQKSNNLAKEFKLKHFGEGEWVNEPDGEKFVHNSINCSIIRFGAFENKEKKHFYGGYLCGYVQIPKDHPLYDNKDLILDNCFAVHGGITFDEAAYDERWIGFDCAHGCDIVPGMIKINEKIRKKNKYLVDFVDYSSYKNFHFVKEETKKLADQLSKYSKNKLVKD